MDWLCCGVAFVCCGWFGVFLIYLSVDLTYVGCFGFDCVACLILGTTGCDLLSLGVLLVCVVLLVGLVYISATWLVLVWGLRFIVLEVFICVGVVIATV